MICLIANIASARFYSRQRHFVELPPGYDTNVNNSIIVNSVIAWSFYPKLLVRDGKGWRNVANNQSVSLYPTSVHKGVSNPPKWLSFYHIMQSSNKYVFHLQPLALTNRTSRSYNAHETSAVEDFAIALVCGDADFKVSASGYHTVQQVHHLLTCRLRCTLVSLLSMGTAFDSPLRTGRCYLPSKSFASNCWR